MQTRRMIWLALAMSIYLGLFPADAGPTVPVQAVDDETGDVVDTCIIIGPNGQPTIVPEDCAPQTERAS